MIKDKVTAFFCTTDNFCKFFESKYGKHFIFVVFKLFFFPDFLKEKAEGNEADYVSNELVSPM
ncbi:MAG: DUF4492 domain-containing protein [Bacteroidaceae bacterium]|nr:DUF4492 domain-containing protein [Bacteroidaceae bacterium]